MGRIYTRVHRLFKIVSLLQARRGLRAGDLAQLCETCERTVYRDLQTLQASGIACLLDAETGGYGLPRDFFMPPIELTFNEALALMVLADNVAGAGQIPFLAPAAKVLEKVRAQLPAAISDELRQLDGHIQMQLGRGAVDDGPRDVYERVRIAIATKRMLRCGYDSVASQGRPDAPAGPFDLHPYALWYCQRAWYVVGRHGRHRAVRLMKLNRFTAIDLTDRPYAIPDDFRLADHLGLAWRMIRGAPRHQIAVRFDAPFGETAADTRWHSTQSEEFHDEDGSITLRFTVDGLDEVVWWVLGYGPGCKVIEPPELAQRVAELARATAARYAPP